MSKRTERRRKEYPRHLLGHRSLICLKLSVLSVFLLSIVEYGIVLFLGTLGTGS